MTREALTERFGEKMSKKIPLDSGPETLKTYGQSNKERTRAKICELWDKESGKVYWLSKNYAASSSTSATIRWSWKDSFPCARPLVQHHDQRHAVPVPDFVLYQDQANELDILSDRIDGLVKALRVRGVYDASQPALQRLLTEGDNNTLIPVDKWMAFSEKGGLKGSIDILPIDTLANALLNCYRARTEIKARSTRLPASATLSADLRSKRNRDRAADQGPVRRPATAIHAGGCGAVCQRADPAESAVICSKFQPQTILLYAAAGR
jgi:hypothetical protein